MPGLLLLLLICPPVFGQNTCEPIIGKWNVANVPCVGTIVAGNLPGELNPPAAIAQARQLLWEHFSDRSPCFFNLELVTKEGTRTRFVYVLERSLNGNPVRLRWDQQREVIVGLGQPTAWKPIEHFEATTVLRDNRNGLLTFMNGGRPVGVL